MSTAHQFQLMCSLPFFATERPWTRPGATTAENPGALTRWPYLLVTGPTHWRHVTSGRGNAAGCDSVGSVGREKRRVFIRRRRESFPVSLGAGLLSSDAQRLRHGGGRDAAGELQSGTRELPWTRGDRFFFSSSSRASRIGARWINRSFSSRGGFYTVTPRKHTPPPPPTLRAGMTLLGSVSLQRTAETSEGIGHALW